MLWHPHLSHQRHCDSDDDDAIDQKASQQLLDALKDLDETRLVGEHNTERVNSVNSADSTDGDNNNNNTGGGTGTVATRVSERRRVAKLATTPTRTTATNTRAVTSASAARRAIKRDESASASSPSKVLFSGREKHDYDGNECDDDGDTEPEGMSIDITSSPSPSSRSSISPTASRSRGRVRPRSRRVSSAAKVTKPKKPSEVVQSPVQVQVGGGGRRRSTSSFAVVEGGRSMMTGQTSKETLPPKEVLGGRPESQSQGSRKDEEADSKENGKNKSGSTDKNKEKDGGRGVSERESAAARGTAKSRHSNANDGSKQSTPQRPQKEIGQLGKDAAKWYEYSGQLGKFLPSAFKRRFGKNSNNTTHHHHEKSGIAAPANDGNAAKTQTQKQDNNGRTKEPGKNDPASAIVDGKDTKSESPLKQRPSILKSSKSPAQAQTGPRKVLSYVSLTTPGAHGSKAATGNDPKPKSSLTLSPQKTGGAAPDANKKNSTDSTDEICKNPRKMKELVKKESKLLEEYRKVQQAKSKLKGETAVENDLSVVMPSAVEKNPATKGQGEERHKSLPRRPLPALPSERLLDQGEKDTPAGPRNLTKELPPPPRMSSLPRRSSPPKPGRSLRHATSSISDRTESRKRKAGSSANDVGVYYCSAKGANTEGEDDSDYVEDPDPMSDGSAYFEPSPLRHQPQRKAKQRRTTSFLAGPRRYASFSSSVSQHHDVGGGRTGRHPFMTATPGIDGVPPLPERETTKGGEAVPEDDEDECIPEEDEDEAVPEDDEDECIPEDEDESDPVTEKGERAQFKWPDEIF